MPSIHKLVVDDANVWSWDKAFAGNGRQCKNFLNNQRDSEDWVYFRMSKGSTPSETMVKQLIIQNEWETRFQQRRARFHAKLDKELEKIIANQNL